MIHEPRCELCGEVIDEIIAIALDENAKTIPIFIHSKCYRDKVWLCDDLNN